ncbi:MAG: FAD-dependent oxidoreductase [Myxococcales bacterium]|nr:FAD-dependent oxidoreductase [Myxococcales bacterium]
MNELARRDLLRAFLGAPALWAVGCASRKGGRKLSDIDGGLVLRRERLGHRMRDLTQIPTPTGWADCDVAVVGGGVTGLSCMRALKAAGIENTMLLELDEKVGGTSQAGSMPPSPHPWGAHYVTVPQAANRPLIKLLQDVGAVESVLADGSLVMAEQHLVADPSERVFYRGRWYEGLYPFVGAAVEEREQKLRFEKEIDRWVGFRDASGRPAFALPMSLGSEDPRVQALDAVSMDSWMRESGFSSERLRWWVEYACRDDYGTTLADTSAWSVFFYFASRKAKAGGPYQEVVTWPDGNAHLVSHLRRGVTPKTGHAVLSVQNGEDDVSIVALDASAGGEPRAVGVRARYVVMATPQFINARVVRGLKGDRLAAAQSFEQSPWMVANLQLRARPGGAGFPLCWDNVLYDSPSLGYVVATHQQGPHRGPTVLTYYYPLVDSDARVARRRLLELGWEQWAEVALSDLERAHPGLRDYVERIDIARWGHGMVRSTPGRIWDGRRLLAAAPHGRIHFAHTDLSGVALFEEAFDQGNRAGAEVVARMTQSAARP